MANEQMELMEAWKASKPAIIDRAIGLSDSDRAKIPNIYSTAWNAARKARFAYPAAKARAEIAAKAFIEKNEPKLSLTL